MTSLFSGLGPLASRYEGFIVDLWGVVHNGVAAFPAAIDCLSRLRGRPVLLLSNAPRRAYAAQETLRRLHVQDDLYSAILTSGEATWQALRERNEPWFARLGRRVFHLGPVRDRSVIEGLGLQLADTPGDADFVVNTGPDDESDTEPVEAFLPVLHACRAAMLPMICANPDLIVMRGTSRLLCAGALAARYAELGGEVCWIGKPDPAIYQMALQMMGLPASTVLAIGDSLRTDIAGARNAGIDSAWVLGGIHADLADEPEKAKILLVESGLEPVALLPGLAW